MQVHHFPHPILFVEYAGMADRDFYAVGHSDSDAIHSPPHRTFAIRLDILDSNLHLAGTACPHESKDRFAIIEPFFRIVAYNDHAFLAGIGILDRMSLLAGVEFPIVLQNDVFEFITRLHGVLLFRAKQPAWFD